MTPLDILSLSLGCIEIYNLKLKNNQTHNATKNI